MNEIRCARCGSTQIIPEALLFDQGQGSNGRLAIGFYRKPGAAFFKGKETSELTANICGECGYVELFAENARALFTEYRASRRQPAILADAPPISPPAPTVSKATPLEDPPTIEISLPIPEQVHTVGIPTECVSCGTPLGGADWCPKCGRRYSSRS